MKREDLGPIQDLNLKEYSLFLNYDEGKELCAAKNTCLLFWKADVEFPGVFDAYDFQKVVKTSKITAKDVFEVTEKGIVRDDILYPVKKAETVQVPNIEPFAIGELNGNIDEQFKFLTSGTSNILEAYPDMQKVLIFNYQGQIAFASTNICSVSYIRTGIECNENFCYSIAADALNNISKLISHYKNDAFEVAIGFDDLRTPYFYMGSETFEAVVKLQESKLFFTLPENICVNEVVSINLNNTQLKKIISEEKKQLPSALQKYFGAKAQFNNGKLTIGNKNIENSSAINAIIAASDITRIPFEKNEDISFTFGSDDNTNIICGKNCFLIIRKE